MLEQEDIENATLEAIYWWNRTEGYYHDYFSKLDSVIDDEDIFEFFVLKIFNVFLSEYSVRRNITAGDLSVNLFAKNLVESGFYRRVVQGDIDSLDEFSETFRIHGNLTNGRHTHSLLSKVAFLINPSDFSLIDSYAKKSLWQLVKDSKIVCRSELDSYSGFISQANQFMDENMTCYSDIESALLSEFDGTSAFYFFRDNPKAFRRRIFDKLLWINISKINGRPVRNRSYVRFLSCVPRLYTSS